jgi:vitamin B12 transporter
MARSSDEIGLSYERPPGPRGLGPVVRYADISRSLIVLAALSVLSTARAEDDEQPYRATGERERGLAALHAEDPTAAGTVIDLDDRLAAGEELRDVLPEIPAARVMSTGADGQYAALGLRGTEFNHTVVLLDDIPLSGPETGGFDLSQLPVAAFERVEVYRGGAPTFFGVTPVGGVLRLMPHRRGPDAVRASLGAESFGGYRAGLDSRASVGKLRVGGNVGLAGAQNDFSYLDDGNTPFNPDDDLMRRRQNADFRRGHAIFSSRVELEKTTVDAIALFVGLSRGEPGVASRRTEISSTNLQHIFLMLGVDHRGTLGRAREYRLRAAFATGLERRRVSDVFGELGYAPVDADDRTRVFHARLAGSVDLTPFLELIATASARVDRFIPDDTFASFEQETSARDTLAANLETRVHGKLGRVPIELRPSIRYEWTQGSASGQDVHFAEPRSIGSSSPSFRLGLGAGVAEGVSLVASAYSGVRNPTLLELFGNRARFLANPDIRPERAKGGDLGVVWTLQRRDASLDLEARAFALRIEDIIDVFVVANHGQVKAINRDEARILGAELGGNLTLFRHLRAIVSAHGLHTERREGLELANRPRFVSLTRLEGMSGSLSKRVFDLAGFVQLSHLGKTFYDAANLVRFPRRTTFDLGVRASLLTEGLSLFCTVRDVFDVRGMDFTRSPLPGRRFSASIQYQKEL